MADFSSFSNSSINGLKVFNRNNASEEIFAVFVARKKESGTSFCWLLFPFLPLYVVLIPLFLCPLLHEWVYGRLNGGGGNPGPKAR